MMNYLIPGDCAEKIRDLADNSIDSIVTDPPYGLAFMGAKWDNFGGKSCGNDSAEIRREKAQEYASKNSGAPRYANGHGGAPTLDAMRNFQSAMTPIFAEALRVAKPGAHLLAFGGTRTYHRLACAIEDAGWEIRECIMWVHSQGFPKGQNVSKQIEALLKTGKTNETEAAKSWDGWNTQIKPALEPIVVARKPLEGTVARFFYCAKASRSERGEGNLHPTVKPLALMRYLVRLVTRKGGLVLDPFMGSGTTGVAAIEEGMHFVGIERDHHYYEIASRRISAAKPEPPTTTQQELPL